MASLYDVRRNIERIIQEKKLEQFVIKGRIGLNVGVVISLIGPDTPHDEKVYRNLVQSAREILEVTEDELTRKGV